VAVLEEISMSVRNALNRRTYLKAMVAALPVAQKAKGAATPPIQLHCDLQLDPAREKEMLENTGRFFSRQSANNLGSCR
jgi:hypothetical protein